MKKTLKTLALFTVLFTPSACSIADNDGKNSGSNGNNGNNANSENTKAWIGAIKGKLYDDTDALIEVKDNGDIEFAGSTLIFKSAPSKTTAFYHDPEISLGDTVKGFIISENALYQAKMLKDFEMIGADLGIDTSDQSSISEEDQNKIYKIMYHADNYDMTQADLSSKIGNIKNGGDSGEEGGGGSSEGLTPPSASEPIARAFIDAINNGSFKDSNIEDFRINEVDGKYFLFSYRENGPTLHGLKSATEAVFSYEQPYGSTQYFGYTIQGNKIYQMGQKQWQEPPNIGDYNNMTPSEEQALKDWDAKILSIANIDWSKNGEIGGAKTPTSAELAPFIAAVNGAGLVDYSGNPFKLNNDGSFSLGGQMDNIIWCLIDNNTARYKQSIYGLRNGDFVQMDPEGNIVGSKAGVRPFDTVNDALLPALKANLAGSYRRVLSVEHNQSPPTTNWGSPFTIASDGSFTAEINFRGNMITVDLSLEHARSATEGMFKFTDSGQDYYIGFDISEKVLSDTMSDSINHTDLPWHQVNVFGLKD